jgi:nitroimidazol reductase NimA-like FMN-containing flavoprotein (pyridoxamine 5'-phosphate oxidase superfamily)
MSAEPFEQWLGTEMERSEIDDLLNSAGWGILSLAKGGEPYSIPISFGYTGTDIYFALIREEPDQKKFEYVEEDGTARLLVSDVNSLLDWETIAVTGSLDSVSRGDDRWTELLDSMEDNAWFSSDYRLAGRNVGLQGWRIELERIEGLSF